MADRRHLGWAGAAQALMAAALFGASTPLAKALLGGMSPWMLAGVLYLGAGIGLALIRVARRVAGARPSEAPLRRADFPWLAAVVLAGGIVGPVLLMLGLAQVEASTASLLLNLEGVLTLGIAWVVFRENVDLRIGVGAAAILLGALVLSWRGASAGAGALGWGTLAIAGACLAWAIDNNLTRKLSSADPLQIATIKGLVAGTTNVGLAAMQGASWPPLGMAAAAGFVGFLGYGVSIALFVVALRHLGSARTSAYFSTAPFLGAALAVVAFGEPITASLLGAAALMFFGTYLHLAERHEHVHEHAELVHEHAHLHDEHHRHEHRPGDPPGEPHVHVHRHAPLTHRHPHYPDIHHRHPH